METVLTSPHLWNRIHTKKPTMNNNQLNFFKAVISYFELQWNSFLSLRLCDFKNSLFLVILFLFNRQKDAFVHQVSPSYSKRRLVLIKKYWLGKLRPNKPFWTWGGVPNGSSARRYSPTLD